jgi:hypothetical protein
VERYFGIATVLLNSFSAMAFTLMAALRLPSLRRNAAAWGGPAYPLLLVACAVEALSLAAFAMVRGDTRQLLRPLLPLQNASQLLIPALYLHVFYFNERRFLPSVSVWRISLALLYGGGLAGLLIPGMPGFERGRPGSWPVGWLMVGLFMAAGRLSSALLLMSARSPNKRAPGRQAVWSVAISLALAFGVPALHFWNVAPVRLLFALLPP